MVRTAAKYTDARVEYFPPILSVQFDVNLFLFVLCIPQTRARGSFFSIPQMYLFYFNFKAEHSQRFIQVQNNIVNVGIPATRAYQDLFFIQVSFRIIGGDPTGIFKINSKPNSAGNSIGELSLQKELDYETTRRYVLTVQGYNKYATNANDPAFMVSTDNIVLNFINIDHHLALKHNRPCFLLYLI